MIEWPVEPKGHKYAIWYENLITKAQNRKLPDGFYSELHHIIPVSFGGSDKKYNLVKLTAREHYIAHLLLWKMNFGGAYNSKAARAACAMIWGTNNGGKRDYKISSRMYEQLRTEYSKIFSEQVKGDKNPAKRVEVRAKIRAALKEKNARDKLTETGMYDPEVIKNRAIKLSGSGNGRAIEYTFIDANKNEYTVKGNCSKFCDDMGISMTWVRNFILGNTTDLFLGWSIKINPNSIRKAITNGVESKIVPESEIEKYLAQGWILGFAPRKKSIVDPEKLRLSHEKRLQTIEKQRDNGYVSPLKGRKRDPLSVEKGAAKRRGRPGHIPNEESRKKMSEARKGKLGRPGLKGEANPLFGVPRSEETKKLISERKRAAMTDEIREKLRQQAKKNYAEKKGAFAPDVQKNKKYTLRSSIKHWEIIDPNGVVYIVTTGLASFSKKHPISYDSLKELAAGKKEQIKGWKVKEISKTND